MESADTLRLATTSDRRRVSALSWSTWTGCVLLVAVAIGVSNVSAHGSHHHSRSQAPTTNRPATGDAGGQSQGQGQGGFHDSKVVRDPEHINEHLQGKAAVNISEMSLEELEFHYFKMHDFDNNTKLDGLEILQALTHLLPYDDVEDEEKAKVDPRGKSPEQVLNEKREKELHYYTDIVDNVLKDDDIDDDGFLTYPEYILARRREEARELREEMATQSTDPKHQ